MVMVIGLHRGWVESACSQFDWKGAKFDELIESFDPDTTKPDVLGK